MALGSQIALYRKKMNLTQETLAQRLGVTNQAVSKWESEQSCPDVILLPKLADIFGISLDELFGRKHPVYEAQKTSPATIRWPDDETFRVMLYVGHRLVGAGPAGEGLEYRYEGDVDAVCSAVSISCGNVAGNVSAAGAVTCGDIFGNANAGGQITCGDIYGCVKAGGNVICGEIMGSVNAEGTVTLREENG